MDFKNILITGGCGFIASNFINYMVSKYPNVNFYNIDILYYCSNLNNILVNNSPNYKFFKADINDFNFISFILNEYNIDCIVHFAAQSHVDNSFDTSLQYTKDNIMGTHTLLEASRIYNKLKRFLHISTDEVYGEVHINHEGCIEESILNPTNPYAATKAAAEMLVNSYYHSYKLPVVITRGNNVYGPNQYPEKVIPRFIKQLKENKKVTIQGNGSCIRAFLHAYDTATAFETVLLHGQIGEIYNIGCDEGMEFTIMEVAKILIKMIKNTENYDQWIEYIQDRPFNDARYYISNKKLKDLGWNIKIDLMKGLNNLIQNKNL